MHTHPRCLRAFVCTRCCYPPALTFGYITTFRPDVPRSFLDLSSHLSSSLSTFSSHLLGEFCLFEKCHIPPPVFVCVVLDQHYQETVSKIPGVNCDLMNRCYQQGGSTALLSHPTLPTLGPAFPYAGVGFSRMS